MFAQKDENFECLQVAHSKNDVKTEVSEAISYIFDHSVFNGDCSNSQFYENVCPKPNDKTKYMGTYSGSTEPTSATSYSWTQYRDLIVSFDESTNTLLIH